MALRKAKAYLGPSFNLKLLDNSKKKYMVLNPDTNKWIHFGQMGNEDFTKHKDDKRRQNYLKRTLNIGVTGKKMNIRRTIYHGTSCGNLLRFVWCRIYIILIKIDT